VRRVWLVVLLGSLSAFGPLSIDMYLPALPQLSEDFHVGASTAQLTLTACLAGLALGQLVAGPLSDRFGRRAPLLVGLALYVVSSLLCAAAPSAGALIGLRFVQGIGGAAGIAISRAIARDLYGGEALARFFSTLMLVNGTAPILAPVIGAQILRVTSWRGVFVVLAGIGAVLAVATAVGLRETLPPELRSEGGFATIRATVAELVRDRAFLGYLVLLGLTFGAMFAYIAGSSFVVETLHHGSPQLFSAIFALNGIGLVAASQANGFLLGRTSARRLLSAGVIASASGGFALLAVVIAGIGLAGIVPALFVLIASLGFVFPNATALALADHPSVAGSASGLIGVFTFALGAVAAPLVGVAGTESAYPMAIVIAILGGASLVALRRMKNVPANA
jgi:DHA1 family bicyclomycin/chloramphenicol resistance-like MFS transporter